MWTHLLSILGLTALCAVWVLFQLWLKRHDPELEKRCHNCAGCHRERHEGADSS
jgi:hypothetical protein